ncbi:Hpt domain-containing protein [Magnetofaba australis]|uniref:Putative Histidine phosphotransfer protein isoform 1 n=1 Tax=Magnetofaba australis IT-1 TaxID=1434232 RepID=A0A1Y2K131_9PROT|nr:Hpt domain-containing protein [Magnetofaba australis]OSM01741.1 putative Histidine phosphotransfer protein isoform 1 [Magnetofaba australis IT-1]
MDARDDREIDESFWKILVDGLTYGELTNLLELYHVNGRRYLQDARGALEDGRYQDVSDHLHRFAGSSASFALRRIESEARGMQRYAAPQSADMLYTGLDQLEQDLEQGVQVLRQRLQSMQG